MKPCISIFIFFICCTSFAQQKDFNKGHSFFLNGKIVDSDTGYIVLWYPNISGRWVRDTTYLNAGSFAFSGEISEPSFAHLIGPQKGQYADFFLEQGKQNVAIQKDSFERLQITGSKSQQLFDSLNKSIENVLVGIYAINKQKRLLDSLVENGADDRAKKLQQQKLKEITNISNRLADSITSLKIRFIKQHPESYVSATVLSGLLIVTRYPVNSLIPLFESLDSTVKNSRAGLYCFQEIEKRSKLTAGNFLADFPMTDGKQKNIQLKQFKGKYVLLEFWASWCVPCREAIPELKKIYTTYHSKGFEVIAISLDRNEKQWKKAIQEDGTNNWIHIRKDEETHSIFNPIQVIPQQILLDKEGMIIWSSLDDNNKSWQDILKNKLQPASE